jgi:hypothetical protein
LQFVAIQLRVELRAEPECVLRSIFRLEDGSATLLELPEHPIGIREAGRGWLLRVHGACEWTEARDEKE